MGQNTKIEWADHSFSPWWGCEHVHAGCDNCYAEAQSRRWPTGPKWGPLPHGTRKRFAPPYYRQPFKWNKEASAAREIQTVFPSQCDPFEDWRGPILTRAGEKLFLLPYQIPFPDRLITLCRPYDQSIIPPVTIDDLRQDWLTTVHQTPWLMWLALTKRPQHVPRMLGGEARENLAIIYSASDQDTLDSALPALRDCRTLTPVLGLSLEPLLGPINFGSVLPWFNWVIIGGESGPEARPCHLDWIRSILKQANTQIPCFVKQVGANLEASDLIDAADHFPHDVTLTKGLTGHAQARVHLNHNKGGDAAEWPQDINIREYPRVWK